MTFNFIVVAWFLVIPFGFMGLSYFIKQFKAGISRTEAVLMVASLIITGICLGVLV